MYWHAGIDLTGRPVNIEFVWPVELTFVMLDYVSKNYVEEYKGITMHNVESQVKIDLGNVTKTRFFADVFKQEVSFSLKDRYADSKLWLLKM